MSTLERVVLVGIGILLALVVGVGVVLLRGIASSMAGQAEANRAILEMMVTFSRTPAPPQRQPERLGQQTDTRLTVLQPDAIAPPLLLGGRRTLWGKSSWKKKPSQYVV